MRGTVVKRLRQRVYGKKDYRERTYTAQVIRYVPGSPRYSKFLRKMREYLGGESKLIEFLSRFKRGKVFIRRTVIADPMRRLYQTLKMTHNLIPRVERARA